MTRPARRAPNAPAYGGGSFAGQGARSRWRSLRLLLILISSCAIVSAPFAPRAMAAYPGKNGAISYFWPDPEAGIAYLAFVTPAGAAGPSKWMQSWDDSENNVVFAPDGLHVASDFAGNPYS